MVEAAAVVGQLIDGRTREDLDTDIALRLAVVRAIEIVGEAASRLSAETKNAVPAVPWAAIAGMRNRLVHAYFDIDYDVVWRTASIEVPVILVSLRDALDAPS